MHIEKLKVRNFRGFAEEEFVFDPHFNVIVGENGSGKTALLEALKYAIGPAVPKFKRQDHLDSRIKEFDIRYVEYEHSTERVFPCALEVSLQFEGVSSGWEVEWDEDSEGFTNTKDFSPLFGLESEVRAGNEDTKLILAAFYGTGRLFLESQENGNGEDDQISSRFRAYYQCFNAQSTFSQFAKWFQGKEAAAIQKGEEPMGLKTLRKMVIDAIPGCKNFYHEFDPDKNPGLKIAFEDGRVLPFAYLSDGTRNFIALMADIAHKCLILNPQLGHKALEETEGVVLIDELDLHLHPAWQRLIINQLKKTFPKVQFFATTHSPFLIQEAAEGELIQLKGDGVALGLGGDNLSLEDIAEQVQQVENPRWSTRRMELYALGKKYYEALALGEDEEAIKAQLTEAERDFTDDPLFYAYLDALKAQLYEAD